MQNNQLMDEVKKEKKKEKGIDFPEDFSITISISTQSDVTENHHMNKNNKTGNLRLNNTFIFMAAFVSIPTY